MTKPKVLSAFEMGVIGYARERAEIMCKVCEGHGLCGSSGDTIYECDECEGFGWIRGSIFWEKVARIVLRFYWFRTGADWRWW